MMATILILSSCTKAEWGEMMFSPKSLSFDNDGGEGCLSFGIVGYGQSPYTAYFVDILIDRNSGTRHFTSDSACSFIDRVTNDWVTVYVINGSECRIMVQPNDTGRNRKCLLSFKVGNDYSSYIVRQSK